MIIKSNMSDTYEVEQVNVSLDNSTDSDSVFIDNFEKFVDNMNVLENNSENVEDKKYEKVEEIKESTFANFIENRNIQKDESQRIKKYFESAKLSKNESKLGEYVYDFRINVFCNNTYPVTFSSLNFCIGLKYCLFDVFTNYVKKKLNKKIEASMNKDTLNLDVGVKNDIIEYKKCVMTVFHYVPIAIHENKILYGKIVKIFVKRFGKYMFEIKVDLSAIDEVVMKVTSSSMKRSTFHKIKDDYFEDIKMINKLQQEFEKQLI